MKGLDRTMSFQTLGFENVNGCFSTGQVLSVPQDCESNQLRKTRVNYNICLLSINSMISLGKSIILVSPYLLLIDLSNLLNFLLLFLNYFVINII